MTNHFENSDFIYMLNQAAGDREVLARQLGISPHQLSYVTHTNVGEWLFLYGNTIIHFSVEKILPHGIFIMDGSFYNDDVAGHLSFREQTQSRRRLMHNNIEPLRKGLKMTQADLAKECNVTRQTINAIENNKYDPTLQLAFALAKKLNTTVDELFNQ